MIKNIDWPRGMSQKEVTEYVHDMEYDDKVYKEFEVVLMADDILQKCLKILANEPEAQKKLRQYFYIT